MKKYEFGGPIGAFFIIIGLPIVIYALFFLCNDSYCITASNYQSILSCGTHQGGVCEVGALVVTFI